jgi:hypothetical protein
MIGVPITPELSAALVADRERELLGLSMVREARREQASPAGQAQKWFWRVEPGMEKTFQSLQGWLLSSVDDSEVSQAAGA